MATEARRFGKYTLVAKLATGGMAEIFLARLHGDGGFEKLVCIKRILPHLAKDAQFVAMFLDEARVAARISHPNVCQVFELGEWESQYYIAMEYLEGVPLSSFRRRDLYPAPPDPRLVAAFGVQACEGLHHAHQLKRPDGELLDVIHRDISPQNLFATVDGIVKVLDFGIAKVQDATVRTSTGAVKGTYAYMAPEQLRNEPLDRRLDVWALGAVLWETLAQRHLFKRDTEFLTFEAIAKLPIPDICEVRPDVPPLLGDTIARALSRSPGDRFASARAFGEALAQAVAPLGGATGSAAIADEVERAFEPTLAEQRMLLRIAREGGQFDLEASTVLGPHGTAMSTTPISNLRQRAEEAQVEVANFVAATQAIDSLFEDEGQSQSDGRPGRLPTDGAFTPAPSRRPVDAAALPDEDARPRARRSSPHAVERPYAAAPREWRYDETEPPISRGPQTSSIPAAPLRPSRLPWMIALVAVAAAATAGAMLYMQRDEPRPSLAATKTDQGATTAPVAAPAAVAPAPPSPVAARPVEPTAGEQARPVDAPDEEVEKGKTAPAKVEVEVEVKPSDKAEQVKPDKVEKVRPDKVEKVKPDKLEKTVVAEKAVVADGKAASGPPGSITIDSRPVYAIIYIDGKKYGETPLVNIKLAPGKHAVRAVSPSGSTRNLSIQIESGKTAPVRRIEW